MLLNQIVMINCFEFCLIVVIFFDKSVIGVIDKVIVVLDLGFNLINDGKVVCVLILELIEE